MPVTLRDVAEKAGVCKATASRVLRGERADKFAAATCRRVLQAAERLGYRPNMAARSLTANRSFLIGVLLSSKNTLISSGVLRGLQAVLSDGEYSPIVFSHAGPLEEADCLRRCLDRRVDGLIVNVSHDAEGSVALDRYRAAEVPIVEIFGRFLAGVPSVNIDNVAAGRKATQCLVELGHRRIAMLTHARYDVAKGKPAGLHFDAWERWLGYEQALTAAGLEPMVVTHAIEDQGDVAGPFFVGGRTSLDRLLSHPARPTAVVCYSDLEAYGLIRAAREQNVPLPERLSIVGFGDHDFSRIIVPALTTMPIPAFEAGRRAMQTLFQRIAAQVVESTLLESELVVRESATSPLPLRERVG